MRQRQGTLCRHQTPPKLLRLVFNLDGKRGRGKRGRVRSPLLLPTKHLLHLHRVQSVQHQPQCPPRQPPQPVVQVTRIAACASDEPVHSTLQRLSFHTFGSQLSCSSRLQYSIVQYILRLLAVTQRLQGQMRNHCLLDHVVCVSGHQSSTVVLAACKNV